MDLGLTAAFIIIVLIGVIYGRIAGYAGSFLRFTDIFKFLLKLINKAREKLSAL